MNCLQCKFQITVQLICIHKVLHHLETTYNLWKEWIHCTLITRYSIVAKSMRRYKVCFLRFSLFLLFFEILNSRQPNSSVCVCLIHISQSSWSWSVREITRNSGMPVQINHQRPDLRSLSSPDLHTHTFRIWKIFLILIFQPIFALGVMISGKPVLLQICDYIGWNIQTLK